MLNASKPSGSQGSAADLSGEPYSAPSDLAGGEGTGCHHLKELHALPLLLPYPTKIEPL